MSPLTVHIFQTKSLIKTEPCNPYQSVSPLPSPIFSVLPSHVDLVTESGPVSYLKYVLPLPFLLPMTLLYFGFLIFCSLIKPPTWSTCFLSWASPIHYSPMLPPEELHLGRKQKAFSSPPTSRVHGKTEYIWNGCFLKETKKQRGKKELHSTSGWTR